MQGPCEHCGNADKSKWLSQCLYKGSFPSRRSFIRSTFDPPCACDAEDEGRWELVRDRRRHAFMIAIGPVGLAVAVILMLTLTGCGERASCWNDIQGRFTSCEDMRSDEINREIDRRIARDKAN